MKISELKIRDGNVELEADVADVGDAREFSKFGKPGRVATATIKDETGEIKLSLWNEQIDQIRPGMRIRIKNGYVGEWKGEKQLTTGRAGTMEVIGEGEAGRNKTGKAEEAKAKPAAGRERNSEDEDVDDNFSVDEEEIDED
ncbi:hypothetical protein COT48_00480 [Candidatus Woesearchaeota archaeon CG08_land_8_20_14_0_20_47_9]|nr:MAG: hypothetical protein AUJ69_04150 [Candidatus Woesearchaeota archaeon CG1_02_47_18]PIN73000.1 MAG: hypothetical protein COV22_01710 [Candidatus Woesearchaeota archaeon CG10_big_fil_rev_8_21_14_0_10_47_5]PIO04417.1 MAG: hypothetical protein COT48_00480 [Candidatus Woesearchaeota archaeon CG08_land_8_20_14_0_20_47_9]HII29451.1 hypothetical protein [Candidatus Woesearchaeota archaeon]